MHWETILLLCREVVNFVNDEVDMEGKDDEYGRDDRVYERMNKMVNHM